MRPLILFACLLAGQAAFAQTPVTPADPKKPGLAEQYFQLKKSSSTFEDYKVIKEYALDVMWKSISDSIREERLKIRKANEQIATLQNDINTLRASLKMKEDSMQDVEFASTHISVFGVDFTKTMFLVIVALVVAGFVLLIAAMTGRLKWMYYAMKEKMDGLNMITTEYEEFKRKALEKQMKLSRELQNERNKLSEVKIQKA